MKPTSQDFDYAAMQGEDYFDDLDGDEEHSNRDASVTKYVDCILGFSYAGIWKPEPGQQCFVMACKDAETNKSNPMLLP